MIKVSKIPNIDPNYMQMVIIITFLFRCLIQKVPYGYSCISSKMAITQSNEMEI